MRFRSVLVLIVASTLLWASEASAQKRIFATVNPNADVFNNTADIFDPQTGTMTTASGTLTKARDGAVAVRLNSGKVLIAGGYDNTYLRSAELYNPADGSFTATGDMASTRDGATSALLSSGTVLLVGGYNGNYLRTMEQYDPVAGTFSPLATLLTVSRQHPSVTQLANGYVLIAGGFNGSFLGSVDIYDPGQKLLAATDDMEEARVGHGAVRLQNGKVLIAGGCRNSNASEMVCDKYLTSAELYDPDTDTFTLTGAMTTARKDATVTLLPDSRVLFVGGTSLDVGTGAVITLASAEIYDPKTGVFTAIGNMGTARVQHTASLLPDGRVLIAGGESDSGQLLASAEIYNPTSETFSPAASMSVPRTLHAAAVLDGGKVLLVGGDREHKLVFDVNTQILGDNVGGNIWFSPDSQVGYVAYTGSGTVVSFSAQTGEVLNRIVTGGNPTFITPIRGNRYLAVVSALDDRIFIIDTATDTVQSPYIFQHRQFGFGSRIELSPDGAVGYISSSVTGEVIKFDVETGAEMGRYSGLSVPAQITVTSDGGLILVVDAGTNTVAGINTSGMTRKYTFDPQYRYYAAVFTISNKVVLNADESIALITSQDSISTTNSAAFIFEPATGAWILDEDEDDGGNDEADDGIYGVGYAPGFTALTPDKKHWIVLSQNYLSLVPTVDPRDDSVADGGILAKNYAIPGQPMGSSNVIVTPDSRYAFFASATTDQIMQVDLTTGAVIGAYNVGDNPTLDPRQPISLAVAPDTGVLVAMSFITNELNLFADSYVYRQTRYASQKDRFTGLSLVNVSNEPVTVTVTAKTDGGVDHYTSDGITNPATVQIDGNAQKSIDVSELLGLDNDIDNSGYLVIESDKPVVVGYTAVGKIQSDFPNTPYTRSLESSAFFAIDDVMHDWIIPEIPESTDATSEISVVNPSYTMTVYTATQYGTDGTELNVEKDKEVAASARTATSVTGVTTMVARGQVVIVGGFSENKTEQTSETFDGLASSYLTAVSTTAPRQGHAVAPLTSGKVLVVGGRNGYSIQKTAELYNPSTGYFTPAAGSMNVERYRHTATRLINGKVLIAGGQNMLSITPTAELFDSANGSFQYTTGQMTLPRDAHTATRLTDGRVLIAGGLDGRGTTASAELYDPATETFSPTTGTMTAARAFHTATLLGDGKVLLVGGYNGEYLNSAELYDPATGTFTSAFPMTDARSSHTATLLSDGMVLVAGGRNSTTEQTGGLDTAEVFDPATRQFSATGNTMTVRRSYHTAVNLLDNITSDNDRILISGGFGLVGTDDDAKLATLASSEIYTPGTRMFVTTSSSMSYARQGHTALLLDETIASGYLRLKSDAGLLATESYNREKGGAPTSVSAIDMAKHIDVKTVYSPRFVISDGRTTILNVINGNTDTANVTLTLYTAGGAEVAGKSYVLAGNAQIRGALAEVFQDASLAGQEGWIKVASDKDQIVGVVTFTDETYKYLGSFELSGEPLTDFIFPLVSEDATDFETELTFLNAGSAAATLTLELWDVDGAKVAEKTVALPARSNRSGTIEGLFGTALRTGNVRVTSSQPVYGMGEIRERHLRFITPIPAVAVNR
ncbi:MAG: hypothetical protein LBP68_04030 [Acidobacteriota bacterium]|jgi:hypothetical protein|nr:hypothetical protein [Acidobacteriota bacterium]